MKKEKSWLPIVAKQEELLVFDAFSKETAWQLACKCVDLAKNKYGNVAIRIFLEETLVFSYLMEGTNLENNFWMAKKLNTSRKTGQSSLRSFLELEFGLQSPAPWCSENGQYALCGGCIPIRLKNQSIVGYLVVSNLHHEEDHQLAADALAAVAGVAIPSVR